MSEKDEEKGLFEKIATWLKMLVLFSTFGVILLIVLFLTRPQFFWRPMADFLNNGKRIELEQELSLDQAKLRLESQLDTKEEIVSIELTDEVLTVLGREYLESFPLVQFSSTPGSLEMVWELNTHNNTQLFGVIQLGVNETYEQGEPFNDLDIRNVGVGRFAVPKQLEQTLFNGVLKVMDVLGNTETGNSLLFQIIGASSIYEIREIEILEGSILMTVDTNRSFYE